MRRTALTLPALALSALLALSACGSGADGSSDAGAAFNEADVAFVTGMQPHHEQAVEMADLVLADTPSPEVAALAEAIKAEQEPELRELAELAAAFDVEGGAGHGGGHGSGHGSGHGGGDGMLTEVELAALEDATGVQAERLFLEGMVEHHRGAVEMAETELAEGENADARDLAARIRDAQTREIEEIEQLLAA